MLKNKELNNEKDMLRQCDSPDMQFMFFAKEFYMLRAISIDGEVYIEGVRLAELLGYDNAWVAIGMTASEPIDLVEECNSMYNAIYITKDDVLALYEDAPLLMTDNDKATELINKIFDYVFLEMNALVKHEATFNKDDYNSKEDCRIAHEQHMDTFKATDYMNEEEKIRYRKTKGLGNYEHLDELADFLETRNLKTDNSMR